MLLCSVCGEFHPIRYISSHLQQDAHTQNLQVAKNRNSKSQGQINKAIFFNLLPIAFHSFLFLLVSQSYFLLQEHDV